MDSREMRFHIKKNVLDNNYSKALTYLQITVVGIITVPVGAAAYFLQIGNPTSAAAASISGVFSILFTSSIFKDRLNSISSKIRGLKI